ncbi:ATP-binding protein [Nesterenkonia pannonica]|uniref:ATP-binding protein n=1 Tax=Nesterenkonia pannonica TaxID=1548602 RepID=UPI002164E8FF|nr:ATP-binding protein [Nesterenkonia pannonica]
MRPGGEVSDDERDQFSLAVSELLTNMITHGETDDASGVRINACLCVRPDRLTGTLSDTAQEAEVVLDGVRMPDPMAESGRGLAISTMILDSLEHTTDTGNVWSFWRSRGH